MQNRREFLNGVGMLSAAALASGPSETAAGQDGERARGAAELARHPAPFADTDPYTEDLDGATWWKGDVHTHTLLSDGLVFPVEACALYKRLGYNFFVQTDHDVTPPDQETWIADDNRYYDRVLTEAYFERFRKNFPDLFPTVRIGKKGKKEYRVLPFAELEAKLNERNRFLVIPGNEVTYLTKDANSLHCNLINIRKPCRVGLTTRQPRRIMDSVLQCMNSMLAEYDRLVSAENPDLTMLQINHPLWTTFDVPPALAIAHPAARFFEVNNSGSMARNGLPPGDCFTHDKWWDWVNATRATLGQPLLYGTGSSDLHNYTELYDRNNVGTPGYVRVAAKELTIPAIMRAFHKGNFYASTGLEFRCVAYNRKTRTLSVSVKPEKGRKYKILFLGTKRGAEMDVRGCVRWNCKRASAGDIALGFSLDRETPYYSPAIGTVLKESNSTDSSYTFEPDDLYVRVKVVTDLGVLPETHAQRHPIAWTQPILNRQ